MEPDWIDRGGKCALVAFACAAVSGIAFDRGDACFGSVIAVVGIVAFALFCVACHAAAKDTRP